MPTLYRGVDTNAFGNDFIIINLATSLNVSISKAVFQCGIIKKSFVNPIFPLKVELTALETKTLQAVNKCYLAVWDGENRKRTCEGSIEFSTQSGVVG